jgi:hypothetical protein
VEHLLSQEDEIFFSGEIEDIRQKRINALERFSKKDAIWLLSAAGSFAMKYLELDSAYDAIKGTIDELDRQQAYIKKNEVAAPPKAAYVA